MWTIPKASGNPRRSATCIFLCICLLNVCMWFILPHQTLARSPFSGLFARFPYSSQLENSHKRITLIAVWNNNDFPSYLRHFFYSAQLNNDSIDLLFINRMIKANDTCIDFDERKVDISWGGNIKIVCMSNEEWLKRRVDYMCSRAHWDCDVAQRAAVRHEFNRSERLDMRNYNWRTFQGLFYQDLIRNGSPFWAWVDVDQFLGRFTQFPFSILSRLHILTFHSYTTIESLFLAGQLTAFNTEDKVLSSVWKRIPELSSADRFIQGTLPESPEENLWSSAFLDTNNSLPGSQLSYALVADVNGDDAKGVHSKDDQRIWLISGRDVLLLDRELERKDMEVILALERQSTMDELGGVKWSGERDLSNTWKLHDEGAGAREKSQKQSIASAGRFNGILRQTKYLSGRLCRKGGWISQKYRLCIRPHALTITSPQIMRTSVVHFSDQEPNFIYERIEKVKEQQGYHRKLLKHNHVSKKWDWDPFPPFDITENLIFLLNATKAEVFEIGQNRQTNLYYRDHTDSLRVG